LIAGGIIESQTTDNIRAKGSRSNAQVNAPCIGNQSITVPLSSCYADLGNATWR